MKDELRFYNSLSRQEEDFALDRKSVVGVYCCGPTVYHYVTIGNWRTYVLSDLVVRVLRFVGYETAYIMNITDVGHLTGDNEGDADTGVDRLEKGAKREGRTAWEIADFYTEDFVKGFDKLNLVRPEQFVKATDHIQEQVALISRIEEHGFIYQISDGMYFDVSKYEREGNVYGELSTLDQIQEGARVARNPQKRDPRDFALWKFSPVGVSRDMEWESPWGKGFPGWHIECSAMSMKYLGEQFEIHVGGEDLRSTHHPNEIAQSEAASGKKPFVKVWLHGAFLQVDGGKMGKSLGNAFILSDIESRGFDAYDLRYFYLTGHYRKPLNFTWEGLESGARALGRLRELIKDFKVASQENLDVEEESAVAQWRERFGIRVCDDLDMPGALAIVWEMVRGNDVSKSSKWRLLCEWDVVLGLELGNVVEHEIPDEVLVLASKREQLRKEKKWEEADALRKEIEERGFEVKDMEAGLRVVRR